MEQEQDILIGREPKRSILNLLYYQRKLNLWSSMAEDEWVKHSL